MGWIKEFGQEYEIPQSILSLLKDGITKDMSWHNDSAPSFGVYLDRKDRDGDKSHDLDIRIFVEHPKPDEREHHGGDRYMVDVLENGSLVDQNFGNDVRAAIQWYRLALVNFLTPKDFYNAIKNWSMSKLDDWYEENVGYSPKKDDPILGVEALRETVAELMWLRNGGSEDALKKGRK